MSTTSQYHHPRIPLQDHSNTDPPHPSAVYASSSSSSSSLDAPFGFDSKHTAETPATGSFRTALNTPPEAVPLEAPLKNASFLSPQFETPKQLVSHESWASDYKLCDNLENVPGLNQTLKSLLSPAFSSPQQHAVKSLYCNYNSHNRLTPPPACIDPSSSLSLSSDDNTDHHASQTSKKNNKKPSKRSKREEREQAFDLHSDLKPPYSYATLIGISILSHKDKRLPLSQIYQWISETFRYYKREDVGWQNSIRHNLSLNKAFVKGEKSKDGKGHFWCIKPGCEEQFLKSRSVRENSYTEVMEQIILAAKRREEQKVADTRVSIPSSPTSITNSESFPENIVAQSIPSTDFRQEFGHRGQKRGIEDFAGIDDFSKRFKFDNAGDAHFTVAAVRTPTRCLDRSSRNTPLLAGKHLSYTSSFSCDLNLDLSPIRTCDTGPLLQPITPANNSSLSRTETQDPRNKLFPLNETPISFTSSAWPTLFPSAQNAVQAQHTPKLGTMSPLRRTPFDSSRKLWHSPSYLEEFYYSPFNKSSTEISAGTDATSSPSDVGKGSKLVFNMNAKFEDHHHGALNSYDDDDMVVRSFKDHPQQDQTPRRGLSQASHQKPVVVEHDRKELESGTPASLTDVDK